MLPHSLLKSHRFVGKGLGSDSQGKHTIFKDGEDDSNDGIHCLATQQLPGTSQSDATASAPHSEAAPEACKVKWKAMCRRILRKVMVGLVLLLVVLHFCLAGLEDQGNQEHYAFVL